MIRLNDVRVGEEQEQFVLAVLRSGNIAQGSFVETLEREFATRHGVAHAVAVSNGTLALVAALQALHIGPGAEVITSPFSFVATLSAILSVGATARFADIGRDFNIDPGRIESLINSRTRAIMPVHLYGQMAEMDSISAIARGAGLDIIEDAAQAVGARYRGRSAGSFGVGCFSFYATKNLSTGEGGMVTTNDETVADRLRLLRNHGMRRRYEYVMPGHNYRLTDTAAALGIPVLRQIDQLSEARRRNAMEILQRLRGVNGLLLPVVHPDRDHVFHQLTFRLTEEAGVSRDEFIESLHAQGVEAAVYYPAPLPTLECFDGDPRVCLDPIPQAMRAAREVVSLPVHQYLTPLDVDQIVESVHKVLAHE